MNRRGGCGASALASWLHQEVHHGSRSAVVSWQQVHPCIIAGGLPLFTNAALLSGSSWAPTGDIRKT
eukprot:1143708-Pelagomonas_calceolata.AAC.3